jgi:DNA-binding CsgD family transcriptional regulator/tetratricopeptide (TPR) repeat protein
VAERRDAHAALADALPDGPARTWHRAEAATRHQPTLAADLAASAEQARARRGYAGASAAYEQAARLVEDRAVALDYLAAAVDDAFLAGDGPRARRLAEQVLAEATGSGPRATALTVLGLLEEHTGTFPRAKTLLTEAAEVATGSLRIRALTEVAALCYLLDDRSGMAAVADRARRDADLAVPEQVMLAAYLSGAAAVFEGRLAEGAEWTARALDLLEGEPSLRDDPRHLTVALMCARWLLDLNYSVNGLTLVQITTRRMATARERGALGPLASALSLAAGGLAWTGDHLRAYAFAGEAVELLDTLGYTVEPGVSHETLAIECAARGRFAESEDLLDRAEDVMRRTGFPTLQPHLAHAMIICALSRGDLPRVVTLGEDLLRRHGGAGWLLEPLGVAPPLVEAYAALGREEEARDLTQRFAAANDPPPHPYVTAGVARCRALVSTDLAEARRRFEQAIAVQQELGDPFELGRTRLLYGMRLRRAGERVAAREQLRAALADFAVSDHKAWEERVLAELAASGERARRRDQPADTALSSQETRVALLVAQGLTNREVATTLFLSPKTVEHHLSSVLRKRGLRTRTELAHDLAVATQD